MSLFFAKETIGSRPKILNTPTEEVPPFYTPRKEPGTGGAQYFFQLTRKLFDRKGLQHKIRVSRIL